MPSAKEEILEIAREATQDRGPEYGTPYDNFNRVAKLWSCIVGKQLTVNDVSLMMIAFKIARLQNSPKHKDSWGDIAGYAAVGFDAATSCCAANQDTQHQPQHLQSIE